MSLFYRAVGFTGQMVYSYYALSKRWSDKIQSVVEDDAEYDTCYTFKTIEKMENDGLIIRKEYPQVPPKVEYYLSSIGEKFLPVLESLEDWGKQYIEYMEEE